jgi:hypothetical protein
LTTLKAVRGASFPSVADFISKQPDPDLEMKLGSSGIPEPRKLGIYVLGLARH